VSSADVAAAQDHSATAERSETGAAKAIANGEPQAAAASLSAADAVHGHRVEAATATAATPGTTTAAASAPAAAGGPTTADAPPAATVTDQVFGPVSRLVSRGDGTHRLMLRLHPADLGEVKVVLTAKDGNVEVTVAAGPEACEALREGSPRLRSLLELAGAGAGSGAVVIRDLASGSLVSSIGTGQQQPQLGTGSEQAGRHGEAPAEQHGRRGSGSDGSRGSAAPATTTPPLGSAEAPDRPMPSSGLDIDI
jgi:flagellar hook-length control protein FliK